MNKYFLVNIAKDLLNAVNNFYGHLGYVKCLYGYPKQLRRNVRENIKYKNIHSGQRCFIIGNGPSLKKQDISMLKNEITFTVNQAARNEQIRAIAPTYHFWIDPVFFNLDSEKGEDKDVIATYTALYTAENRPVTFLPQQAYNFVKKTNLESKIDLQFFFSTIQMKKDYSRFDFTKSVPAFGTVVQTCIAMAIYMGFSEIYLLGCDSTGIITMINSALESDRMQYSYEITENEKKRLQNQYKDSEFLKTSIIGFADLIDIYEKLNRYAVKHHIKLVNCSAETIITSIPRMKFEDVVKV